MMRSASLALLLVLGMSIAPLLAADDVVDEMVLDANHHAIEMRFDPISRIIQIEDTITIIGHERLDFALAKWLRIDEARKDGRKIKVQRAGNFRLIALGDQGRHSVQLKLSGRVPALPRNRARASGAFASPDGTFIPNYSEWMPVNPGERITYRLAIDVPAPFRAVATGPLVSESEEGKRNHAVFRARKSVWPPTVFVGPYKVAEKRHGAMRIRTYFPEKLEALSPSYLNAAAGYLSHFEGLIGPYPNPEFHIVAAPVPVGLGFPNLTYIGQRILPLPFIRERSLAHEVLHAWLGNGIGVDYETGNWSEGLTTYLADYGLTESKSADKAREMRLGWLRDYAALPAKRDTALAAFQSKGHDASQVVGYDKTAFLFHMLRQEIGTAAFDKGLKALWHEYKSAIAGWQDLQRVFEATSGTKLAWFFEQWVERVGAPSLRLIDPKAEIEDGKHVMTFTLVQGEPAYRLRVPIVIETSGQTHRKWVRLEKPAQRFSVEIAAKARSLAIDPSHDLFRRLAPGEAAPILRDVTLAKTVTAIVAVQSKGAREAAGQLARRLADSKVRIRAGADGTLPKGPLMLIGTEKEVSAILAASRLPTRPETLNGQGTARAWVVRRRKTGDPLLVVEANDDAALAALVRPLPHYKRQSFIVFDGRKATKRGVWPAKDSPLSVTFD